MFYEALTGFGVLARCLVPNTLRHAPRWAARIALHTRGLVAGMSSSVTPSGASAFTIASITAGNAPTVPASPAPLAPSGLVFVGTGLLSIAMAHIVSARGIA